MLSRRFLPPALFALSLAACAPSQDGFDEDTDENQKPFTSAEAVLLTADFDGELAAPWQADTTKLIKQQLFYTVGQLNEHESVARLDKVVITNVKKTSNGADGWMKVTYHASLPVGWGHKSEIPDSIDFTFPRRIGPKSLATFTTNYMATCAEAGGHDVNSGNFWFHYRPEAEGCSFNPDDVRSTTATVKVSTANTTGKYPEYDRVWADGALRVVAVFGKYTDYSTDPNDAGIWAYNQFIETTRSGLASGFETKPPSVPTSPGTAMTDVTFTGSYEGRQVVITALLIDSPKVAKASFDTRYADLTKNADIVIYNGHAGLGANIQALAAKGTFTKGQYSIYFMNGCDTFAYLDDKLTKRSAAANPGDTNGTVHLDMVTNVMPAYFNSMPDAALELIGALANPDDPRTYDQIFAGVDKSQVVVATGEEDNTYQPAAATFAGIERTGTLQKGMSATEETPILPAGTYTITTKETKPTAAGDIDLYVAVGYAPTLEMFDQRPYLYGSNETVTITLDKPAKIFAMAHAYEGSPVAANAYSLSIH